MDNALTSMREAAAEQPAEAIQMRSQRLRRFVMDIVALKALLLGFSVLSVWLVAICFDGDVSEVRSVMLRVVAIVFFFRVFQFYIAAMVLVAGLIALAMRYRKIAAINLAIALVLALPLVRSYFPKSPPTVAGKTIKIYSGNLYASNRQVDLIIASIKAERPDVIVLMEVTNWSYALLRKEFGKAYPYEHRPFYNGGGIVLSRLPFREDAPVVRLGGDHTRVPVVFDIDGREFAMYPVHLLSPGRLSLIAEHREQIREFLEIARNEKRPMMIVGDCNMTPQTPNFAALRNVGFRSSYELIGFGMCSTWGPRWWPQLYQLPGVQIDQILLQPPLTAKSHYIGADTGSDHRPIVAEIGFNTDTRNQTTLAD